MKNYENPSQLRHLRKVQAERKQAAIARAAKVEADRKAANAAMLRKVGGAK